VCAEHQMRCAASHRGRAASRAASKSAELQLCVRIRGWATRQHVVCCDCLCSRVGQPGVVVLPAFCAAQCLCSCARLRARAGAEESFHAASAAAHRTVMVGALRGDALRPCDARAGAKVLARIQLMRNLQWQTREWHCSHARFATLTLHGW